MAAMKTAARLLARFSLCPALSGGLWIVSIRYRIGPFDHDGSVAASESAGR